MTAFVSDKARALLAYLAVESNRPHRRETLAGLLWPECPQSAALNSLRQALFNLRQVIDDRATFPHSLLITRQTLQFNHHSDHWLDVTAFSQHLITGRQHAHHNLELCDLCLDHFKQATELYRGSFLEGLTLKDSLAFEEWVLLRREHLHRQALDMLQSLANHYEQRADYEPARGYALRQIELDPWREEAHQQLMRLLALGGQRSAALAQYHTCQHILAQELGVAPTPETTALYERIRAGEYR